jgi:hypothetical protein
VTDTTRRDAIARSLCARICDERRSVADLQALDAALSRLEHEDPVPVSLVDQLRNDRFHENEGSEIEQAHRRGWNAGMEHAAALVRADAALAELRDAQAIDLRLRDQMVSLDVGGEG